jgi:competence protein ComGC
MINFKNKIKNSEQGSSLIELVFYISIFVILVLVTINAILVMTKSFRETTIQATLESGGAVMERLSREIKQASSITSLSSSDLVLATKDQDGNNENVEFVLSGSDINFLQNGVSTGALNSPNLEISNLSFTQITTAKGTAIKIFFTVEATSDTLNRTVDFYNTVVLRGDY